MSIELKIKSKHLAKEARIIREEEHKLKGQARALREYQKHDEARRVSMQLNRLTEHRKWDVRNEARATHLARAYLAGKKYSSVENKCKDPHRRDYLVKRVFTMINKYGKMKIEIEDLQEWFKT